MTLEELSSTDVECEWAVRKKDVEKCYAVVPLQDFCHVEQTTDIVYTISDEQRSRFRRSLLSACPASAAALHVRGRRHANASFDVPTTSFQTEDALLNKILARDLIWEEQKLEALPEELKSYYKDNVQVSSPKAYNLAKSVQQQSSTWLAERSHRITGSVCYELYTYTKNKAPNWEKKIKTMLSQEFQNTAMVYGTETETVAKEQYMLKCGMTIYNFGLLVVPTIPWLGFSPDGIAVDGDSVVLLEIKCPIVGKTTPADGFVQNLPYITVNEQSDLCLKKKHRYYGQVQLGMLLTGADKCHFVVFASYDNSFIKIIVPFCKTFAEKMVKALCVVYFNYMLPIAGELVGSYVIYVELYTQLVKWNCIVLR